MRAYISENAGRVAALCSAETLDSERGRETPANSK